MKEYDPEWGRAFWTGTVAASCDHARMLSSVKCPVLITHHFRMVDGQGRLLGALSDVQAEYARALIEKAGSPVTYLSFPRMGHSMHGQDPELFTKTLVDWAKTLPPAAAARRSDRARQSHSRAGQPAGLLHPGGELRLVELVVLVDVEVAHVLVLGLAGRDGTQRRAAEERHLDVLREAMEAEEPALALDCRRTASST